MKAKTPIMTCVVLAVLANFAPVALAAPLAAAQAATATSAVAKKIGAIKAINGNSITLSPDAGPDIALSVGSSARIVRIAPREKDLKNAVAIQLQDLKVGDRIRARGSALDNGKSMTALEIVVMPRSDIEARHQQDQQDWQKRGVGGLVKSVDAAAGTVTISMTGLGGTKSLDVHAGKTTVIRRYAADSVSFDNAKASSLDDIHPGDQLRARGDRSAEGAALAAEEIVTGSFRNVAGTVISVDASAGTVSVQDLLSKKSVQVKVSAESQLHKLPAEMAQRIAMRLKGSMPPGMPGAAGGSSAAPTGDRPPGGPPEAAPGGAPTGGGTGGGVRAGGAPDFNQMLSHMPAVALADLHKGDALLIVATEGTVSSAGTAITLLSGVEPILQAAPTGSQAMMLTPWSLGGGPGGGDQ